MPARLPRRATAALAPLLAVLALLAPSAVAQSDPFGSPPVVAPSAPQVERAPVAPGVADEDDDGLESWQELLIFLGGLAVLGGIATAIIVDARRRRPHANEDLRARRAAGEEGHDPAHRRAENRKRRAKAKRARDARKRNRPKK